MSGLLRNLRRLYLALAALGLVAELSAAELGTRGGAEPRNIDEFASLLRHDAYSLELMISYGTSGGGSAGHLALSFPGQADGSETVYSANFYADRSRKHAKGF